MTKTRTLGKLFGVEVKIHGTFLLLLAFLTLSGIFDGGMVQATLNLSLTLIIFTVVVMHEFGHILAARRFGIKTLDVILSPLGGVARLQKLPATPKQEIVVALAGPAVNLVLAGIGFALLPLLTQSSGLVPFLSALTGWFITTNLVLLGFNLIPALPMDGGRVLRALLSKKFGHVKATEIAAKVARWSALGMAVYAVASGQFMLLVIAGAVFVMSWVEVFQAKVRETQQNPAFQMYQKFQGASNQVNSYSQVVDQYGNPLNAPTAGQAWNVKDVRWADRD